MPYSQGYTQYRADVNGRMRSGAEGCSGKKPSWARVFNGLGFRRPPYPSILEVLLVPWAGLEPATSRLGGGRSIQLSYQGVLA